LTATADSGVIRRRHGMSASVEYVAERNRSMQEVLHVLEVRIHVAEQPRHESIGCRCYSNWHRTNNAYVQRRLQD